MKVGHDITKPSVITRMTFCRAQAQMNVLCFQYEINRIKRKSLAWHLLILDDIGLGYDDGRIYILPDVVLRL